MKLISRPYDKLLLKEEFEKMLIEANYTPVDERYRHSTHKVVNPIGYGLVTTEGWHRDINGVRHAQCSCDGPPKVPPTVPSWAGRGSPCT